MKANMGGVDRTIRVVVAAFVAILYFTGNISGTFGLVAMVLAGVFLATSLISFCPLYAIFGINTCPIKQ
jgi:hypothetical protein